MTERQAAEGLRAVQRDGRWRLDGAGPADLPVINEFLGYVADRGYSPRTERAYAFDLLAFARWLVDQDLTVGEVTTDALLRFLTFCRAAVLPGQAGGNVVPLRTGRSTGYAPSTINRRMAAISGLFDFRAMRDPALVNPVPRSAAARRSSDRAAGRVAGAPGPPEVPVPAAGAGTAAVAPRPGPGRDRGVAGEFPLGPGPGDRRVDVVLRAAVGRGAGPAGAGCGHPPALGPGRRARATRNARVPLDVDVAGLVQTYLLAERPESASTTLFLVAKGSHRGQPLTPAGLRTVFRYHRAVAGVPAGHPHALRHSFGTALAEAGVDLAVLQALMGHDRVDSSAAYIHLAPTHVRASYDAARARQRADV